MGHDGSFWVYRSGFQWTTKIMVILIMQWDCTHILRQSQAWLSHARSDHGTDIHMLDIKVGAIPDKHAFNPEKSHSAVKYTALSCNCWNGDLKISINTIWAWNKCEMSQEKASQCLLFRSYGETRALIFRCKQHIACSAFPHGVPPQRGRSEKELQRMSLKFKCNLGT